MLESVDQQYVMIGQIARSHGVDGTVLIVPAYGTPTIFDNIDLVRLQNARGDLIPARVESVRVQQKNDRLSFFVKFDHITDRNKADALRNFPVYINRSDAEGKIEKESSTAKDDLTSFNVLDENGDAVGVVADVTDNPAHPILIVQTETDQLLIPVVDEYVTEMDVENAIIYCRHLNQLINL